ncbi:juvenile hormone esterase isoform X2 [Anabrus simplex]|uniref:juvenile hormone esterase isoform X2 n=1 Tax=Anabrus simplex TaxID=316456 RepID=UPI0035A2C94A
MPGEVTVDVAQGTLRGRRTSSTSGGTYYSFQGIPYAKPPIGPLRFKVAEAPEPWSGVRDALEPGNACTQFNSDSKKYGGSEDCLYLNVYTPKLPAGGSEEKPVMVWIHGGGYMFGSGNPDTYGPDYLVDEGVVVVNVNYRLGVLGLFHRVIAQSGAATFRRVIDTECPEKAFRLGKALGFTGKLPTDLVEFLRSVDDKTLVKAANEHALTQEDRNRLVVFPFSPTLETEVEGVERFLPGKPAELLEKGMYHDVPFMTGITDREGILSFKFANFKKSETVSRIDKDLGKIILPHLRLPKSYSKTDEIVSKVKHFYFKDRPLSEDLLPEFTDMYTDIMYTELVNYTVKKMADLSKLPIYLYMFSCDGKLNFFKKSTGVTFPGACHADDLGYLFHSRSVDPDMAPDCPEALTRARVVKMWTNFAKTGNPTPVMDSLLPVTWERYAAANPCYLEINEDLNLRKNIFRDRIQFWEDVYSSL